MEAGVGTAQHIVRSEGTQLVCQPISISRRFAIFLSVFFMMEEGFRMPCRLSCKLARTGAAPGCLTLIFFPIFTLPKCFVFRETASTAGSLADSSIDIKPCACANFAAARARFSSRFSSSSRSRAMSTASVMRFLCTLEFYARTHGKQTQVRTAARAWPRVLTLPMLRETDSLVRRVLHASVSCETSSETALVASVRRHPMRLAKMLAETITRRNAFTLAALAAAASSPSHAVDGGTGGVMKQEMDFYPGTPYIVDPAAAAAAATSPMLAEQPGSYSTISAALSDAPSGGVVIIRPGTYNERLIVRKPVKLLASTGAVVNWKSDKPYEAALDVDVSGAADSDGFDVLVSGLTIRHSSPSIAQNYGAYVHCPTRKVKFLNCDVASSSGSGIGVEGGNVTLYSCSIHDCKNHGVLYVGSGATGRIERCVVGDCKLNGVLLRDGASPTLKNNLLKGNGQYGAALIDCRGVLLDDNEVVRNGKGAVSGECDDDV